MPRLQPVTHETATPESQAVLEQVKKKMGGVPNILATLANSAAAANGYLAFSAALAGGTLPAKTREAIALSVGQANECDYCLAAHTQLGKGAGLTEEETLSARHSSSNDPKTAAILKFARRIVDARGNLNDAEVEEVRSAGVTDGEIAEIVGLVSLNIYTNYFNHIAGTETDFPAAPQLSSCCSTTSECC